MSTTGMKVSICRELEKMSSDECNIMFNEIMSLLKCTSKQKFIQKLLFNKEKEIFNNDILNAMCAKSFAITKSENINMSTTIPAVTMPTSAEADREQNSKPRAPQPQFSQYLPICILAKMSSFLCNNETFQFGQTNRDCYLSTQMILYFKYRSDRNLLINDKIVACIHNGQMNTFNYSHCNTVQIDIKNKLLQSIFKQSVLTNNNTNNMYINTENNDNNINYYKIKPNKGLISALYNAKNVVVHSRNAGIIPINVIFDKNKSNLNYLEFYGHYYKNDDIMRYSLHESPFKQFSNNYDNYFKSVCNSDLKCIRNLYTLELYYCTSHDNKISDISLQSNFKKLSLGYQNGDHGNISLISSLTQSQESNHFDRFIHSNLQEFSLRKSWVNVLYVRCGPGHGPFDKIENYRLDSTSSRDDSYDSNRTNAPGKLHALRKLNIQLNKAPNWKYWNDYLEKMFTFWEKMNISQNIQDINIWFEDCPTMRDYEIAAAGADERMVIGDVIKNLIAKIVTNKEPRWKQIKMLQVKVYSASKELVNHCFDVMWHQRNSLESNPTCNFKVFIATEKGQVLHQVPCIKSQEIDEQQWKNKQQQFLKLMKLS